MSIIPKKAWEVISKCIKPADVGMSNEFYRWVDSLNGVDSRYSYVSWPDNLKAFSSQEWASFKHDALMSFYPGNKPWVWSSKLDIDKNSYYIARNPDWTVKVWKDWKAVYIYHATWEEVDWDNVKTKKERVFWFFTRDAKKMFLAPIWYRAAKTSLIWYIDFLVKHFPTIMTKHWFEVLRNRTTNFFNDIENWRWSDWWYNTVYNLLDSEMWNHWYFIRQMFWEELFSKMLSDKGTAREILWYNFNDVTYREFAEAAAAYAGKATWWHITVIDVMWRDYTDRIYWKKWLILYEEDDSWKMVLSDNPQIWVMYKSYFMKLSVDQQIRQAKSILWSNEISQAWFRAKVMFKIWTYNAFSSLLRFINVIGKPWLFSAFMTFAKNMAWAMPLLILNSTMFLTDKLARAPRLDWDWGILLKKYWLWWWAAVRYWRAWWIWQTLWDTITKWVKATKSILEQWLFNIWESITHDSYRIRQLQVFFEAQFPWIKSVTELMDLLDEYQKINPDSFERLIEAANWYAEYSIRNMTTNTWVSASTTKLHATENQWQQPIVDTFYALWHFFAGWWWNKVLWWWHVIKTWLWNVYRWEIWSWYIDKLLNKWTDVYEASAKMTKKYLENEDLIYTLNKFYYSYLIGKYISRLSNWWWKEDTLFWWLEDIWSYIELFSWEVAAVESLPERSVISDFYNTLIKELDNWESLWEATAEWWLAATKEFMRRMFRKLYNVQILAEWWSLVNRDWDAEERNILSKLFKAIDDNTTWFLYYLKDTTENWDYDYYTPKWPNAHINSILWVQNKTSELIWEEVSARKYFRALHSWDWFVNWALYSMPIIKQINMAQLPEVENFKESMDKFRATKWYQQMTNNLIPSDFDESDWRYAYNVITWRLINNSDKINNELKWEYSFKSDDWTVQYNLARQAQEELLYLLMKEWLTKEQANKFTEMMNDWADWREEEAIRTLAYLEAKTPWSSLQAVAFLMNRARFDYAYVNAPKDEKWSDKRKADAEIYAAKKYAKYIPEVDRARSWTQIVLHYAKVHDTALAPYISWPGDNNKKQMKLITPWEEERYMESVANWKEWDYIHKNSQLVQNFQAQLMVDIEWANGNPNARKLMNWFATIFNTNQFTEKDWSVNPLYAVYAMNQLETIYNHIDWLAMEDENSKRILKQWTLMFGDKLLPSIIKNKELMARDDVQTVVKDWVHYRYKDFRELDQIATQAAEEALQNNVWKSKGSKKNMFRSWLNKQFTWFKNRYDYMKNRAYSKDYTNYRVFDWTPRTYPQDYLSESEFLAAKRRMANSRQWWPASTSSNSYRWKSNSDDWIWVSTRRWASLAFVKREDIDKPTEYKLPRRKRRVKKWSWVKPISTTTWKHLTPTPKKKW